MDFLSKFYFNYSRIIKTIKIYLLLAGPGLIVMIADNDAGGITTYAATGAKFGYNLIWFLVLLGPVAYFVQEMTVRLGAVTKHGHAEAIFSAFGSFWGWFSLLDLSIVNWLTMVTEFIGMTAALSIFGVPPIITVIIVIFVMLGIVMSGRYWTWEKITMAFCLVNLIYIPAAVIIHPSVSDILRAGIIPNFPGGFNGELFFFSDGKYRHDDRAMDDLLPAERCCRQADEGEGYPVGKIRHICRRNLHGHRRDLRDCCDRNAPLRNEYRKCRPGCTGHHGSRTRG